ncbi:MAG: FecCD family ABC transporter permease [Sphingomonadaceae bacterium]
MRIALPLLLIASFILSLVSGKVWIMPGDWLADNPGGWIMAELRLPRAILGLVIGGVLGLAGAVLQGYVRNPLADPTIIGVSASAALGGVIAIMLGLSALPYGIFACAMLGAAGSVVLLSLMARKAGGPLGFILGGTILSTLAGSLTAFLISISPSPFATSEIVTWLMGALTDRGIEDVLRAVPFMLAGGAILALTGRPLDALTLGEDGATSLGIDLAKLRWMIVGGVGLSVGAAVAVTGVVGFVGLIVPHVARLFVGERPSAILLPSVMGGAILMLVADSLVRLMPGASEIRLGVAMSVLGAPVFFLLLTRVRDRIL